MQEKGKVEDYIIKNIHVTPINETVKHETNSLKIFADMETPTNFRQDDCAIIKMMINKGHTNTIKHEKGLI